jgi:hypothetical protein
MNRYLDFVFYGFASIAFASASGCSGDGASVGGGSSGTASGFESPGSNGSPSGSFSSSEGDALYAAPQGSVTPGSVFGLWGGTAVDGGITFDMRMKVGSRSITLANRCSVPSGKRSEVVSVSAAARVSEESVVVLETKQDAKNDGVVRCSVSLTPRQADRCAADEHPGFERDCFTLEGTRLTLFGETSFEKLSFTKLSD